MGKYKYPRIPMSNNMIAQILSTFDHTNEGHYSTKARYLSAIAPLVEFLVKEFHLQKFANLSGKHLRAYVKKRQADGIAPATIMSDLSAIRYVYRLVGGKNRLPDNAELGLEKRKVGEMDRSWLPEEIEKAVALAKAMGRTDVVFAIGLSKEFGLRVSEVARIRVEHIEKALDNDHLWVKGKGGQVREVPVERSEQRELLNDLKAHATKNGLQGMELVLSENKKYGVKRKIDSWQNWVINHRSKFTDADRTNDVKAGYKPKVDKITFHGLRHYYTQKRDEWLEENHIRNAKRNLSESLGHHRESITKIYSNKK